MEKVSRYDVLEKIAESGFAVVYKGRDPASRRLVAIKISVAQDEALRSRFLREAEKASRLLHPNIARIFEFGSGDGRPYLVEEFLAGPDLRSYLRSQRPTDGRREMELLAQVAHGLHYAHRNGVLHRDVKPATVHLEDGGRVKLVDFGLARLGSAAAWLSGDRALLDAAGYLPPELALGLEADGRTDVYCFGALAYELLAGQRPFSGDTLPELVRQALGRQPAPLAGRWPDCPIELSDLVGRCLARDPGERYAGFEAIAAELAAILEETRLGASQPRRAAVAALDAGGGGVALSAAVAPERMTVPLRMEAPAAVSLDDTMAIPPDLFVARPPVPEPDIGQESLSTAYLLDPPGCPAPAEAESTPGAEATVPIEQVAGGAAPLGLARPEPAAGTTPGTGRSPAPARSRARRIPARALLWAAGACVALFLLAWGAWRLAGVSGSPRPASSPSPAPVAARPALPAAAELMGLLVLDASPWAEVRRLVDDAGRPVPLPANRFTPLPLRVPPGRYQATLGRPGGGADASCTAVVVPGGTAHCGAALGRVDVAEYFKQAGWWR